MRMYFKRGILRLMCLTLVAGLVLSNPVTAFASETRNNETVDYELLADGITIKQLFTSDLATIGVDLDTILKLPFREDFYQAGEAYMHEQKSKSINIFDEENVPRSLESQRLAYAWKMAEWSQSVNSTVIDLEKESIYMYLSHYVDVNNPLATDNGIDLNSNKTNIWAKFIVPYDRQTYDLYLSRGSARRSYDAIKGTYDFVKTSKNVFTSAIERARGVRNATAEDVYDIYRMLNGLENGGELMDAYVEAYTGGKSLEETVEMVKREVQPKPGISSDEVTDKFIELMLSVGTLGPVAVPLMMMNIYMELGLNLYDKANFYAMRMYYNFRIIDRMDYMYYLGY